MDDYEHEDLLKEIISHPGRILISGYDNEMYNDYLHNWHKAYKTTVAEAGQKRTEILWMNYPMEQQITLF